MLCLPEFCADLHPVHHGPVHVEAVGQHGQQGGDVDHQDLGPGLPGGGAHGGGNLQSPAMQGQVQVPINAT